MIWAKSRLSCAYKPHGRPNATRWMICRCGKEEQKRAGETIRRIEAGNVEQN